jgi:hypothetical protein
MTRRQLAIAVMGMSIGIGAFVPGARAGSTVDLLFVGVNGGAIAPTDTVTASPGDVLTMGAFMSTDVPLGITVFSIDYDLDAGNELDVVSAFQWKGVAIAKNGTEFYRPISSVPNPLISTRSSVESMEGANCTFLACSPDRPLPANPAVGYQMGTVVWKVTGNVTQDGADVVSGLLAKGIDGWYDGAYQPVPGSMLAFNSATVNSAASLVPEPGTASLLGLGLLGLVLAGCRSRS